MADKREVLFTPIFKEEEERRIAKYFEIAGDFAIRLEAKMSIDMRDLEGFKSILLQIMRELMPKLPVPIQKVVKLCERELRKETNILRSRQEYLEPKDLIAIIPKFMAFYNLLLYLKESLGFGIKVKEQLLPALIKLKKAIGIEDPEEALVTEEDDVFWLIEDYVAVILGEDWRDKYVKQPDNTEGTGTSVQ